MRTMLLQLLTILFACQLGACTGTSQPAVSTQPSPAVLAADTLAIRVTLEDWYAAMYKIDTAGILAPLTPHFLLLEDTLPLSGAELVARLKKGGTDTKWTAEFSDLRTRTLGDVAWTTLKNHETAQKKDGKQCQADFLETIVFVATVGAG